MIPLALAVAGAGLIVYSSYIATVKPYTLADCPRLIEGAYLDDGVCIAPAPFPYGENWVEVIGADDALNARVAAKYFNIGFFAWLAGMILSIPAAGRQGGGKA